jgi:hypothetical protein
VTVYVISYDLNSPGQNYDDLHEAIKNVGATWWHCLTSTWMVVSDKPAIDIANVLWKHMDANDHLLINPVAPGSAWAGFTDNCEDWIKRNL